MRSWSAASSHCANEQVRDPGEGVMAKIVAGITISVDGYIAGPNDGPGCGLGVRGERLHYWVFGGPWTYDSPGRGQPTGVDKAWLDDVTAANGAVIAGRGTYEAAGHWGDTNPFGVPFFVVTHRPEEQPASGEFTFVGGLAEAIGRATTAAGSNEVHVMGGADVIRQALGAGIPRRALPDHRPGGPRIREEALRGLYRRRRAGAPRCAPITVRDLCRLPGQGLTA